MKEDLLDIVVGRLIAEGITENNFTSFRAIRALRKCVMGRKLLVWYMSGNEIRVQKRLAELAKIKQQFTAKIEGNMQEIPPEFNQIVNDNFFDLI